MKLLFYIFPLLVAFVYARVISDHLIYDDCSEKSWTLSKIRTTSNAEGLIIIADIAYGSNFSNVIREVTITLPRCNSTSNCRQQPVSMEMNFPCSSQNLTAMQTSTCRLAEEISRSKSASNEIQRRFNQSDSLCITYVDASYDFDLSGELSSEESRSESLNSESAST